MIEILGSHTKRDQHYHFKMMRNAYCEGELF